MKRRIKVIMFYVLIMCIVCISESIYAITLRELAIQAEAKHNKFKKEVKSMIIVGEINSKESGRAVRGKLKLWRKGEKTRQEEVIIQMPDMLNMPEFTKGMKKDMEVITICDGKNEWVYSSFINKWMKIKEEEQKIENNQWFEDIPREAKLLGTDNVKKNSAYVIEVPKSTGIYSKIWIDKKNFVVLKEEEKDLEGNIVTSVNLDYRRVKGNYEIPYKTKEYKNGQLISTMIIKSVKINKKISDSLFKPNTK
ncbi:MAG: outer membrane lipoprotein-sorting protein [bacterium]|nr:outer membrane lipoprotein-sorting protein [bacterium]